MIKTFSDVLDDLMSELTARTPFTNLHPSAAIRGLLEVIATAVAGLYGLVQTVMGQSFVQTAIGAWLDLKVREVGITRNPAVKARVYLTFSRAEPATENITVPAGTICKSRKDAEGKDYRFITVAGAVLEEGQMQVVVEAEAEQPGASWNVGQDTITRMITRVTGIDAVTNADFIEDGNQVSYLIREGSDPETDEQLRGRAITTWETLGLGGTREAYRTWALSVPGVIAASVLDDFPFGPGTVGVVILGENGAPTPELISEVHQFIKARKPLTADVRVLAPEIVTVDLALEVTRFATADRDRIDAAVRDAVAEYARGLQLGEGLVIARLIDAVMDVEGVYNLRVLSPGGDVPIGVDRFLVIGELEIVHRIKGRSYQDSCIDGSGGDEATDSDQIMDVNRELFGIDE